jgi:hypothetical protein
VDTDLKGEFARAYRKHEKENTKLYLATMTEERIGGIGGWLGHDCEFKEAVALIKMYLRKRGYKIGSSEAYGDAKLFGHD